MARIQKSTEYVRHTYTPEECLKMGQDLAGAHNRLAAIDDEEAVVKSKFKERKATVEQSINSLSRDLSNGWTMQNVECKLSYGEPNPLEVTYRRIDTSEVVKVRAMNSDEMQEELPLTDREGEVVVIPPAEAEANTEKSAEAIGEFFGPQETTATDQPEPIADGEPSAADLDAVAEEASAAEETAAPAAGELWDDVPAAATPADAPQGDSSPAEGKKETKPRKPRGFDKPTNETAW